MEARGALHHAWSDVAHLFMTNCRVKVLLHALHQSGAVDVDYHVIAARFNTRKRHREEVGQKGPREVGGSQLVRGHVREAQDRGLAVTVCSSHLKLVHSGLLAVLHVAAAARASCMSTVEVSCVEQAQHGFLGDEQA